MKETPTQKLKRELLKVRQQLFEVCNNPDSIKSSSIILSQKSLKAESDIISKHPYVEKIREMGFGKPKDQPFTHFESEI